MQIPVKRFAFKVEYFEFTAHTDLLYRLPLPSHINAHTQMSIVLQPVTDPCHPVLCESVDILTKLELWAVGLLYLDHKQRVSRPVVPSILPASPACPGPIAPSCHISSRLLQQHLPFTLFAIAAMLSCVTANRKVGVGQTSLKCTSTRSRC